MPAAHKHKSVLALDVGAKRIGLALASLEARLPRPLTTLLWDDGNDGTGEAAKHVGASKQKNDSNKEGFFAQLAGIIEAEGVGALVVGLPRGLQGQHTAQTGAVERFTETLREHTELPIYLQDEALTSRQAEAELQARGKVYDRGAIDALAATYILEDFLTEHSRLDVSLNSLEQQKVASNGNRQAVDLAEQQEAGVG
jgi:putative Holliday junction resolvase